MTEISLVHALEQIREWPPGANEVWAKHLASKALEGVEGEGAMPAVQSSMLEILERADRMWPTLIEDLALWTSVDVDYEPPRVERIWCPFGDGVRLFLHRIHPCETALFHPHPWPSAVRVLAGPYEMAVGYGAGPEAPPVAALCRLATGSSYAMENPNGWHSVRPISGLSLSLMVTAKPWADKHAGEKRSTAKLGPLTEREVENLIHAFRHVAWKRRKQDG